MKIGNIITIILFGCLIDQTREQCVRTSTNSSLPKLKNYGSSVNPRITLHQQAIIPSYEFTCCGVITKWGVDVKPDNDAFQNKYTIDFQVWRPSPTTPQDDTLGTGYYSLVGNNRFSAIFLTGGIAEVTPSPQDYIQFRPGDVLGFYVEEASRDNKTAGVVVLTTGNFSSEVVWYASVYSQNVGGCVSAGSNGNMNTLLRGAPVISRSTKTINCSTTTGTPQPTTCTETKTDPSTTEAKTVPIIATITAIVIVVFVVILFLVSVLVYKKRRKSLQVDSSGNGADHTTHVYSLYEYTTPTGASDANKTKESQAHGLVLNNDAITTADEVYYSYPHGEFLRNQMKQNAYTLESVTTAANVSYNYPAKFDPSNTVEMKQNYAYIPEQPLPTTTNESYNYQDRLDPSNTIEVIRNKAYAVSSTIEKTSC